MGKSGDILFFLFQSQIHRLAGPLREWMDASPRFTAFVDTYRDKIRKKIRVLHDSEAMLDLQAELEVAACLLADRRIELVYEPYASARRRGPDFSITYRTNLTFNVEVTRLRIGNEDRVLRTLLEKLGQMLPGMPNLLVMQASPEIGQAIDLSKLLQDLKTRVEHKDPTFFAASGYTSPAAFYKDFLHLNGILLWLPVHQLWINKQAKPPLDEKVMRQVASLLAGSS